MMSCIQWTVSGVCDVSAVAQIGWAVASGVSLHVRMDGITSFSAVTHHLMQQTNTQWLWAIKDSGKTLPVLVK